MTDDGPSNDLDKRLREKIEQELEKRRQARIESGSNADEGASAAPETDPANTPVNESAPAVSEAVEPSPSEQGMPTENAADQMEEPPTPSTPEPVSSENPLAPAEDEDDVPEVVAPAEDEDDVPEVVAPAEDEDDVPEVVAPAEDDVPEVVAPAEDDVPEVVAPAEDDIPEVVAPAEDDIPEVVAPADADSPKKEVTKAEKPEPTANGEAAGSKAGGAAEKSDAGNTGKKTKTATGLQRKKKKKDPLGDFAKGSSKNKGPGSKTKTSVGGRRTKGPSATRSLSENEQRLLEEKAKIDEKYRRQKMILYPSITVGTIVLAVILYFLAIFIRDFKNKPAAPRQPAGRSTVDVSTSQQKPSPQPPANTSAYASWADLENAVDRLVTVQKEPAKAITEIKRFQKAKPDDEALCVAKIKSITESYLEQGLASPDWKSMQPQINLGLKSTNPEDVELAISKMRSFAASHPKEYFLADYMIEQLNERYASMTGGLMP